MKQRIAIMSGLLILSVFLAACNMDTPQTITPDAAATVEAMIAATTEFEAQLETAVAEAVDQSVSTAVDEAMEIYAAESEAEMADMINQAVSEAIEATESYTETSTDAAADGEITTEELQTIEVYVQEADDCMDEVEDLIAEYYALFEELALTTIDQLAGIEEEIAGLNENIESMNAILTEISEALNDGLAIAEESIAQLQMTAQAAGEAIQDTQEKADAWKQNVQSDVEARMKAIEQIEPTNIASSKEETEQQIMQFLESINGAFADNSMSQAELAQISQLAANTAASLSAHGGAQGNALAARIDGLMVQLAQGNMQQASRDMNELFTQLNSGFSGLSLPDNPLENISPPSRRRP